MPSMLVNVRGAEDLRRRLDLIAARGGDVRGACLVFAQAVAIRARAKARARGGRRYWSDVARQIRVEGVGFGSAGVYVPYTAAGMDRPRTIRPKNARALTIPVSDEARGRRAGEFELGGRRLFVIEPKSGDPATVGILGYSDGDEFHALFALRSKAEQKADPWFPAGPEIEAIGRQELDRFADRLIGA